MKEEQGIVCVIKHIKMMLSRPRSLYVLVLAEYSFNHQVLVPL